MVRNLTTKLLEENGYTVLAASGGDEAMIISEQYSKPIQLLITDVVMPKMSGKQVAENLVAKRSDLKVLFMSGYTDDAIVHHGVVDSDIAFIQKPFSEVALTEKVRNVLDNEVETCK
jgi:two-component system, cell cycle sensor histidine kinase and response regulator CckA